MYGLTELKAMNDRAAEKQLKERRLEHVEDWVEAAMQDAQALRSMVDPEEYERVDGMVEGYSNVLHYIRTGQS